jgi:hypothetical protein
MGIRVGVSRGHMRTFALAVVYPSHPIYSACNGVKRTIL